MPVLFKLLKSAYPFLLCVPPHYSHLCCTNTFSVMDSISNVTDLMFAMVTNANVHVRI